MSTIICLVFALGLAQDVTILLNDGKKLSSSIEAIENEEIRYANGQTIPVKKVSKVILRPVVKSRDETGIRVFCQNGSRINATQMSLDDYSLQLFDRSKNQIASLPRTTIERLELSSTVTKEQWANLKKADVKADGLVVLRNGRLDLVEGVVLSLSKKTVQFKTRDRVATIQLAKIVGITFFQAKPQPVQQRVVLTDILGHSYRGQSIQFGQKITQLLIDGKPSLTLPSSNLAEIDFSQGQIVFLDTVNPQTVNWKPFFQAKVRDAEIAAMLKIATDKKKVWTRNKSFGKPLRLEAKSLQTAENPVGRINFERGLSIKGGTKLVFEIPNQATEFHAIAGIQASRSELGSAMIRIACDGQTPQTYQVSARDTALTKIEFPLKGSRLSIEVDYGDQQDLGDIVTLGNARFVIK